MGVDGRQAQQENEVLSLLQGLHNRIQEQNELLKDIRGRGVPVLDDRRQKGRFQRQFPFSLSKDVAANTTKTNPSTESTDVPYDAIINGILVGFPGVDNGFGVKVRTESGERFLPRNDDDEYISTPQTHVEMVPVSTEIDEGTTLVGEYVNFDTTNSHTVTVVPNLKERV